MADIPSRDVFSKAFYEARDGIHQDLKRLDHWLSPKNISTEQYINRCRWLILELKIHAGLLDIQDFSAAIIVECLPQDAILHPNFPISGDGAVDGCQTDSSRNNEMLIGDIKLREGVQARSLPSRVNLSIKEKLESFGANTFYVSVCSGAKIIASLTSSRELQPLVLFSTIDPDHLPRQVIHRSSQIVNCISSDQWDALRRFAGENDGEALLNATCTFDTHFVGLSLHPSLDDLLEVSNVLVGPFDLEPSI